MYEEQRLLEQRDSDGSDGDAARASNSAVDEGLLNTSGEDAGSSAATSVALAGPASDNYSRSTASASATNSGPGGNSGAIVSSNICATATHSGLGNMDLINSDMERISNTTNSVTPPQRLQRHKKFAKN